MAGQTGVVVTVDGEVLAPGAPLLHADDLAAVRGDGVFETLLVRDDRACLVEPHLQRLTQSARLMDLPEPDLPKWRHAIETATQRWAAHTGDEGAMRLIYSRGRESGSAPTAYVMVNAVPDRVALVRRDECAMRVHRTVGDDALPLDRKSTRLNSSHEQ
jgi:4-amino-4-deoxychorismate lyase